MNKLMASMLLTFVGLICLGDFRAIGYRIPPSEEAVNQLLGRISPFLKEKYQMHSIATRIGMPDGVVQLLGLHFTIKGPITQQELRKLLVNAANDFLTLINNDEALRTYLKEYPFRIQNVEIHLFLKDSLERDLDAPYIGIARIGRGRLEYLKLATTDISTITSREVESYEQAVQELAKEPLRTSN